MPHYRLAAFDMDGTLLNSDKEIPASAIEACRRAWKAGKILALDTGRAVSELSLYPFSEMGIRYGACACGTVIYDFEARKVLATRTIPKELIPVLVEASRKEDLMFQAMIDGIGYVEAADVERMDHFRMGVYQPLYRATSSFAEDIRALSGLPLDFTFAETTSLETTPQGVSKGTGLADLCEVLGVPIAEAIGVGDAFNDVPMLKMAGLGAAMGNSNEEALRAADVVVKDNDHDGIAEVIDKYLLG